MFADPKEIVQSWDLRPGMRVADFGSGSGHNSIESAKVVGRDGIIYAFDIQEEALSALRGRASLEKLSNIELRRADLEKEHGTGLADSIVDFTVISNILFQVDDKEAVIREAYRILKSGGRLAFIEWDETDAPLGPPKEHRINRKVLEGIAAKAGFDYLKEFKTGQFHYGVMFVKK